jgi:hypothetical protein
MYGFSHPQKRTSAAKAACSIEIYGTAEAVPFVMGNYVRAKPVPFKKRSVLGGAEWGSQNRTSAAKAGAAPERFTARLKPCPS